MSWGLTLNRWEGSEQSSNIIWVILTNGLRSDIGDKRRRRKPVGRYLQEFRDDDDLSQLSSRGQVRKGHILDILCR